MGSKSAAVGQEPQQRQADARDCRSARTAAGSMRAPWCRARRTAAARRPQLLTGVRTRDDMPYYFLSQGRVVQAGYVNLEWKSICSCTCVCILMCVNHAHAGRAQMRPLSVRYIPRRLATHDRPLCAGQREDRAHPSKERSSCRPLSLAHQEQARRREVTRTCRPRHQDSATHLRGGEVVRTD